MAQKCFFEICFFFDIRLISYVLTEFDEISSVLTTTSKNRPHLHLVKVDLGVWRWAVFRAPVGIFVSITWRSTY